MSPSNATVVADFGSVKKSLAFTVIAPQGIGYVRVGEEPGLGAAGTNGIDAETIFWAKVMPTNVSFARVQKRENIPDSPVHHWPNGTNSYNSAHIVGMGAGSECAYIIEDTIGDGPFPASRLFNGTNYVDFSYSITWTNEYLNASSNWIPFATMSTTTEYKGSNKTCRVTYQGVPGAPQGPWAAP
jgi:hypothetical protein